MQNALLAIAAGRVFGLSLEECAAGLAAAPLTRARLQIKNIGGVQFIDDSYNANPDSTKAALRTLAELETDGQRIAVLGQMAELGAESARGHREVGEVAASLGIDRLISLGKGSAEIARAARAAGLTKSSTLASAEEAAELLCEAAQPGRSRPRQRQPLRPDRARPGGIRQTPDGDSLRVMMFFLHRLTEQFKGFNVFYYVTFRAVLAAITAFAISLLFGNYVIRKLISLKIGQPIRTAAEVRHLAELHGGKQGTPTMGGVLIIGSVVLASIVWARPDNPFVWLVLFCMVYLGALGFVDDYLKVTKKKSDGVSGRLKLVFQILLAGIVTGFFLCSIR